MTRSIKAWPTADRPREKLLAHGPGALSDAELLAVLLRTGDRSNSAIDHGRALMQTFGSLHDLGRAGLGDLRRIRGIGPVKAAQIVAAFEIARRYGEREFKPGSVFRSGADIYEHFRGRLAAAEREHFYAVLLDNKHRKIKDVAVSQGSLTASIVHPRDVFAAVVREAAAAVIFVHNHPSGDPTPSKEDLEVTRRLRQIGEVMGVRVLDHVVVGKGCYVSFVEHGYW